MLYRGRHPFSEPETYSLGNYLLSRREEIKVFLDIHSFGQLFMSPWGHTTQYSPHYKSIQVYKINILVKDCKIKFVIMRIICIKEPLMKKVSEAIFSVHGKRFKYGPASIVICKFLII